jgi:hypothetical protein
MSNAVGSDINFWKGLVLSVFELHGGFEEFVDGRLRIFCDNGPFSIDNFVGNRDFFGTALSGVMALLPYIRLDFQKVNNKNHQPLSNSAGSNKLFLGVFVQCRG